MLATYKNFIPRNRTQTPTRKETNTMAVKFIANYSKRLGLPGYSSHQYNISVEVELTDLERAPGEAARLYQLLQQSVDREIQQTGFVPDDNYGESSRSAAVPFATPGSNGHHQLPAATQAAASQGNGKHPAVAPTWQCSAKQHLLINDLARRIGLNNQQLDERAQRLFSKPAHQLNKLSASGLIDDLLSESASRKNNKANGNGNGKHRAVAADQNGGGA